MFPEARYAVFFGLATVLLGTSALSSLPKKTIEVGTIVVSGEGIDAPRVQRREPFLPIANAPIVNAPIGTREMSTSRSPCLIEGTVLDAAGAPIAGAHIVAWELLAQTTPRPMPAEPYVDDAGDDGHFSIEADPGDYAVYAYFLDAASTLVEPLTLAPGEQVTNLVLALRGPSRIGGLVVDTNGDPHQAVIDIFAKGMLVAQLAANHKGLFSQTGFPDAPLDAVASSRGPHARRSLARPETDLIFRLGRPPGELHVAFVDEAGQPVEGAMLTMFEGDDLGSTMAGSSGSEVSVQASVFHVRIEASADSAASDPMELDLDEDERHVTLVLHARGSVSGRVTKNGSATDGHVLLVRLDGVNETTVDRATLSEDGYAFTGLTSGRYEVRYVDDDDTPLGDAAKLAFTMIGHDELALPDLRLDAGRIIRGTVVDENGLAVADVSIDLVDRSEESFGSTNVETDDQGRFELSKPLFGTVRLRADGSAGTSPIVTVNAADEDVTLTLAATGDVEGLVRGPPATRARVRCTGGLWHDIASDGRYVLACAPGSELEIERDGERRRFPIEIDEAETTYTELRW